jgi:hypothetical protein
MHWRRRRRIPSVRVLLHVHRHLSRMHRPLHVHVLLHRRYLLLMLLLHGRHLLLLYWRTLLFLFPNDLEVRDSSALHRPLRPSRSCVREENVLKGQSSSGDFSHFAVQDGACRLLESNLYGCASKVGHGRCGRSSRDALEVLTRTRCLWRSDMTCFVVSVVLISVWRK